MIKEPKKDTSKKDTSKIRTVLLGLSGMDKLDSAQLWNIFVITFAGNLLPWQLNLVYAGWGN